MKMANAIRTLRPCQEFVDDDIEYDVQNNGRSVIKLVVGDTRVVQ